MDDILPPQKEQPKKSHLIEIVFFTIAGLFFVVLFFVLFSIGKESNLSEEPSESDPVVFVKEKEDTSLEE